VRSDTLARYQAYQLGLQVGAIADYQEVRQLEGGAPLTSQQLARLEGPQPAQEEPTVPDNVRQLNPAATRPTGTTFAADDMLTMTTQVDQQFRVDLSSRTISGLAVPYGGARAFHDGQQFEFSKGTIRVPADPTRVKLFVNHDSNRAVGYATSLEDTDDGLRATFKVVESPAGDEALLYADQHVWDGLSAGFRQGSKFRAKDGVQFAVDAPLGEISVCPSPAFDDARVSAVALSADNEGKQPMTETTVTPATPEATPAQPVQLTEQQNQQAPQFAEQVTQAINAGFQQLAQQMLTQPQREFVPANGGGAAQFTVNEELPYRFDGSTSGEHCFTDDLRDMQNGNQQAKQRLERFMDDWAASFAVSTTNVSAFNPTQNRPELYVPSLQFTRPLWDSVSTGSIDNQSPFNVPKFGAASGLVGPHTQGVEPTPGAFSATVQNVAPSPVSGKVEINREVWDLGGNPQTDTIVWGEMQNAYFEGIETNLAVMLNALSAATLYSGAEINLAGAVDSALDAAVSDLMTDLQFVRGGNRYTQWVADAQFYKALTKAKDTSGRKLYPQLGPTNAAGQAAPMNKSVNVNGQDVLPAWALSNGIAANTQNSYAFVKSSVWAWASAPKRFTFEYQVKSIDMAVWGYTASAVLRNTDVIRIDYTTADV
jgi:HK97 family phage prohead protease